MMEAYFKLPRLYVTHNLDSGGKIDLSPEQAHYLNNVLRRKIGDKVRLFNGQDGEWLCALEMLDKKSAAARIDEQLHVQPTNQQAIHLLFAPIKKNRQDWLIEKVVELGATDLHPIVTQNTEVRTIKKERIETQILEAAEQCERFTIPKLHKLQSLNDLLVSWTQDIPVLACLERHGAKALQDVKVTGECAILIGPEGGFTEDEKQQICNHQACTPVSLGNQVLRCETAAVKALVLIQKLQPS